MNTLGETIQDRTVSGLDGLDIGGFNWARLPSYSRHHDLWLNQWMTVWRMTKVPCRSDELSSHSIGDATSISEVPLGKWL